MTDLSYTSSCVCEAIGDSATTFSADSKSFRSVAHIVAVAAVVVGVAGIVGVAVVFRAWRSVSATSFGCEEESEICWSWWKLATNWIGGGGERRIAEARSSAGAKSSAGVMSFAAAICGWTAVD